jgi:hypothetical protein
MGFIDELYIGALAGHYFIDVDLILLINLRSVFIKNK